MAPNLYHLPHFRESWRKDCNINKGGTKNSKLFAVHILSFPESVGYRIFRIAKSILTESFIIREVYFVKLCRKAKVYYILGSTLFPDNAFKGKAVPFEKRVDKIPNPREKRACVSIFSFTFSDLELIVELGIQN